MIHSTAVIADGVVLQGDCEIGPFSIIEAGVVLGPGARIGSHCHLGVATLLTGGRRLTIGAGAVIRSHSVFYAGSSYGNGLATGHHVTSREGVTAGAGLQIGTGCDLQGEALIGDHVRMHSHVQVNQQSRIGNFVWLFPHVVLLNDPQPPNDVLAGVTVADFAAIAARATVLPGVTIGRDSLVGAGSLVTRDVGAGQIAYGVPARAAGPAAAVSLRTTGRPAYPWRRHFHRGYPPDVVARWCVEFPEG